MLKYFRNIFFRKGFGTQKWKNAFGAFGDHSEISYPAILQDRSRVFLGNNTKILKNSRIQNFTNLMPDLEGVYIGDNCYLGFGLTILNGGRITIGNSVLIASNVLICSENHGMNPESEIPYMDQLLNVRNVTIGDGAWLGQNVCVLPGVTIGKKAIVGAGSIVTKDVPDYCIAVGNPARIIKKYNFNLHLWENVN